MQNGIQAAQQSEQSAIDAVTASISTIVPSSDSQQDRSSEQQETPAPAVPQAVANEILRGLNSHQERVRQEAVRACYRLMSAPEQFLCLAEREAFVYRTKTVRGVQITLGLLSAVTAGGFLACQIGSPMDNFSFALSAFAGTSLLLAGWLANYLPRRARRELMHLLSGLDDPRFLGPALTMLVPDGITDVKTAITLNSQVRNSIIRGLKQMLPHVRADHQDLLTREQMRTLLFLLSQSTNEELVLSILQALRQIGDENAIPTVTYLTRAPSRDVREAAAECLEYLTLRADQKRQSQTLLRASAAVAASPEVLLRPAVSAHPEIASDQLLRAQS